jgi:prepilin-type N-terminal cleavage/methylation domain-containing protein
MRRARRSHGFTLTELLIVIFVIAAMCAMLLPTLGRAREKARSTQCANNLRQWGLSFSEYADDNNDFLPRRGQGPKPLEQINRPDDWFNALPPYLKLSTYEQLYSNGHRLTARSSTPFVCPSATDPGKKHFLPYAMNMNLCPWGMFSRFPATKFSDVVQPVVVVALADAPGPYSATYPSDNLYDPVPRHNGCLNVLFLTGSVQPFSGPYIGCGTGDPQRLDVHWLTGTESDAWASHY